MWELCNGAALAFANSNPCLKSNTLSSLDVNQRSLGRLALGVHGETPNEAAQSYMDWASSEAIETQSEIRFQQRLEDKDENKWAAKMHKYL